MKVSFKDVVETGSIEYTGGTVDVKIQFDITTEEQRVSLPEIEKMSLSIIDLLDHTTLFLIPEDEEEFQEKFDFISMNSERYIGIRLDKSNLMYEEVILNIVLEMLVIKLMEEPKTNSYSLPEIIVTRGKVECINTFKSKVLNDHPLLLSNEINTQFEEI